MNDRSDELSTADLAGQSAGSGATDERAVGGETADRMGEQNDGFRADRPAEADYGDNRGDYADDRVSGMGSGGFAGGTPADQAAYADDDPTMAGGRRDGRPGAEVTGGPVGNDLGAGGVGGQGVDAGYQGGMREPAAASTGMASTGTAAGTGVAGSEAGPLLDSGDTEGFRARWTDVQTGFVDAPRKSVEQADALVAELMQHLAKSFADERNRLESQWDRGEDIPTDDLRTAFQRYRSFFERLLST